MNLSEMKEANVHFNTIKPKCVCALFNRLAPKNDQMIQNTNIKYEEMQRQIYLIQKSDDDLKKNPYQQ